MATDPMNVGDWASAVQNIVQTAAIVVGGAWAYYKFVRRRTFHRRAELRVEASAVSDRAPAIEAKTEMQNTGGANIPLRVKILRVAAFSTAAVDSHARSQWKEIATSSVFEDHGWIESQETISDDVLVPLPAIPTDTIALRVTCAVYEHRQQHWYRRHKGGGIVWTAHSIVPLGTELNMTEHSDRYRAEEGQREADESEIHEAERHEKRQREATEEEIQQIERETENTEADALADHALHENAYHDHLPAFEPAYDHYEPGQRIAPEGEIDGVESELRGKPTAK